MQTYKSLVFYHRDDLTKFLNDTKVCVVNISWVGDYWVLFYYN